MLRFTHLKRRDEIEHPVVAGSAMLRLGGKLGMGEKAQRVEAMVQRHDEDAAGRETRAVVARLSAGADDEASAVNPNHRRQSRSRRWGRPESRR